MNINRRLISLLTKGSMMDSYSKITKGLLDEEGFLPEPETPFRPPEPQFAAMSFRRMIFGNNVPTPVIKVAVKVDGHVYEETKLSTKAQMVMEDVSVAPNSESKPRIQVKIGNPNVHALSR